MTWLPPLLVALPLVTAALLATCATLVPGVVADVLANAVALVVVVLSAILLHATADGVRVTWFGGWHPRGGVAIGVAFVVDPTGAALALLAAVLVLAALAYSWRYFDQTHGVFQVLVLVFFAAMEGFSLTGDLFNLFVFFELMGVAAYALTAYRVEETGPVQAALNFAVTNSVGAFFTLVGIALVYGGTGALNLAQIATALQRRPLDGLVVVGFAFVCVGFLVKAAIVPFHFWLADAHAAAPTPVCVLLSGAMCQLGVYAVARVYWSGFATALEPHADVIRPVLVTVGVVTALVGGAMALLQRQLKRLLAFSTISYQGLFLTGVGLLDAKGLAGAELGALAHGLAKGALFLAVGILLYRRGSVDELNLRGCGSLRTGEAVAVALGLLALSGLPLLGTFAGKSLVDEAAAAHGYSVVPPLLLVAAALSTAAILRAAARVFLGVGPADDPLLSQEPDEEREVESEPRRSPVLMSIPAILLAVLALLVSVVPGVEPAGEHAAELFVEHAEVTRTVLHDAHAPALEHVSGALPNLTASSVVYGVAAALLALALAALWLSGRRAWRAPLRRLAFVLTPLRAVHTGHVGDQVAWIALGAAALGSVLGLVIRP